MGHTGTVLVTVVVAIGLTGAVLGLTDVTADRSIVEPPVLFLVIDDESFRGIQGDYCWSDGSNGSERCVEKLRADKLAVKTALLTRTVERNASVSVTVEDYSAPEHLNYTLMTNEGGFVRSGEAEGGIGLDVSPGIYLLVVQATWEQGMTRRIYQLEVVQ